MNISEYCFCKTQLFINRLHCSVRNGEFISVLLNMAENVSEKNEASTNLNLTANTVVTQCSKDRSENLWVKLHGKHKLFMVFPMAAD